MKSMENITPASNAALIVIDLQKAIDAAYWAEYGPRNNPDAEQRLAKLIRAWRASQRPVIFIRHDSKEATSAFRPGMPTHAFKETLEPEADDKVIAKSTNSAFIGTELHEFLTQNHIRQTFFAGVKTNNSVEATVRMAGNLGFDTYLLEDCCFTFGMKDYGGMIRSAVDTHNMALANLQDDYCQIITSHYINI